jgi:hypothetical protein
MCLINKIAAFKNHVSILEILIKNGADIDKKDNHGLSAVAYG